MPAHKEFVTERVTEELQMILLLLTHAVVGGVDDVDRWHAADSKAVA